MARSHNTCQTFKKDWLMWLHRCNICWYNGGRSDTLQTIINRTAHTPSRFASNLHSRHPQDIDLLLREEIEVR